MNVRRRIHLPRSFFHIMNRGARKVGIFADEIDRRIFVNMLGRFATNYEVPVLGWCLMPNHYHVETDTDGPNLCAMMRDLDGNYARSFNERHDTTGCLFQGPFKSVLIDDAIGVAHVNRYIHLNSLDIGERPSLYRWSSCGNYLGLVDPPSWLDLEPVRRILRNEDLSDTENYARYLQEGLETRPRKSRKADPFSDFSVEWIRFLEERCIERLAGKQAALGRLSLQSVVCYLAFRLQGVPAELVAEYFGYGSVMTVRKTSRRVQERIEGDPAFGELIRTVLISATQK